MLDSGAEFVHGLSPAMRRPGFHYVATLEGTANVKMLEAVKRGAWEFFCAHMADGTKQRFRHDGQPVVIRGGAAR